MFPPAEIKPAARTQVTATESKGPSVTPSQESESLTARLSTEASQSDDAPSQTKPANMEAGPEQGTVNPSTKDVKAIISTTKEPSTASVPVTDQPMEVSLSQPSSMAVVRAAFLETSPKDNFHRSLTEPVTPTAAGPSDGIVSAPESKPNGTFPSLAFEEKPHLTPVERLAEMVTSPSHSTPVARASCPPQTPIFQTMGDQSIVIPTTTLIPLTPKIGMGKPAITKRKFSPGRPRVKQVGVWASCPRRPVVALCLVPVAALNAPGV